MSVYCKNMLPQPQQSQPQPTVYGTKRPLNINNNYYGPKPQSQQYSSNSFFPIQSYTGGTYFLFLFRFIC